LLCYNDNDQKQDKASAILEKNKLIAMLSIRDVVKAQVTDLRAENHYLKDYISDKYPG